VTIEGPDVVLSAEATQALAMVLHELVTNAAKYGALSVPRGQVSVRWVYQPNGSAHATLAIDWQETGGPAVKVPTRCGFGTSVIRDLIPYELGGAVDLSYVADGVRCRIELPCAQNLGRDQPSGFTGSHSLLLSAAESQAAPSH
jgi:two-component sensor histidine kinase